MAYGNLAIGIDLGTTYCCVAGIIDGEVKAIENLFGSKTMPSCVAFTEEGKLIGSPALQQMKLNPERTIFDVKRLIGRKSDDSVVQEEIDRLPFKIEKEDENGVNRIKYKMVDGDEIKYFTCEQISSILLKEMVRTAQNKLGSAPTHAVITIPAYYGHNERKATEDSGKIAGLNVLRVINEPTAAAIGYYGLQPLTSEEMILVYDLGGGTFDVSILDHSAGEPDDICLTVLRTGGDPHLGGRDFDAAISLFIEDKIREQFGKIELSQQNENDIFIQSEIAKKKLSVRSNFQIEIDDVDGEKFSTIITRAKFDTLIKKPLDKTFEIVQNTLEEAHLKNTDITKVILVGGSTKIPKLRERIKGMFPLSTIPEANQANPDEVVAIGAALLAAYLVEEPSRSSPKEIDLFDVTALSLGVKTIGERMSFLLKRNSPIPNEGKGKYFTVSDNQTSMKFEVYEGERASTTDNNLIGTFTIQDIPPKKKEDEPVLVKLTVDKNGIADISAIVESTGKEENLTINVKSASNLSASEIEYMIAQAVKYEKEDRVWLSKVDQQYKLIDLIYKVRDRLKDQHHTGLQKMCDTFDRWLAKKKKVRDKEEYSDKYIELNEFFQSVFPN